MTQYEQQILDFKNEILKANFNFDFLEERIFNFQIEYNPIFKEFSEYSNQSKPFLPISAFKSSKVIAFNDDPIGYFESSGTTEQNTSRHYFRSKGLYHQVALTIFETHFGNIQNKVIFALLPNYLEKEHSSLVDMVKMLKDKSGNNSGGFYLYNHKELQSELMKMQETSKEVVLFGVSFALLDYINEVGITEGSHITIIETGGMKGRKKEIIRDELHQIIRSGFPQATISSEYGMTELFSQAYLQDDGWFKPGYSMRVFTTEINDPYARERCGKTGIINVIDLANVETCSFITTEDLGIVREDGCFKVLGRLDHSDRRGCNLMIE